VAQAVAAVLAALLFLSALALAAALAAGAAAALAEGALAVAAVAALAKEEEVVVVAVLPHSPLDMGANLTTPLALGAGLAVAAARAAGRPYASAILARSDSRENTVQTTFIARGPAHLAVMTRLVARWLTVVEVEVDQMVMMANKIS
jgi:hypothetical protein